MLDNAYHTYVRLGRATLSGECVEVKAMPLPAAFVIPLQRVL